MSPPSSPSGSRWVGAAIFVVAAVLRLALMQSARFGGDEARDYAIAVDIAHGRNLPLLGPSITGGRARLPGPFYNWMTAIPRLVTNLPEAGNVLFELSERGRRLVFWLGLRRPFGRGGASRRC